MVENHNFLLGFAWFTVIPVRRQLCCAHQFQHQVAFTDKSNHTAPPPSSNWQSSLRWNLRWPDPNGFVPNGSFF
jgi:hypothetical protein